MVACKDALLAVLLTLLIATATCAAVNQTNCDRYRSRKAQVVVQDYILPRADKLAYTLPESCLIHPQRDMCAVHPPPACAQPWHVQRHASGARRNRLTPRGWDTCCQASRSYAPCRYALQEAQRIELQRGQWKCGICSQTVRGSHHLDAHMDEVHQDQLVEVSRSERCKGLKLLGLATPKVAAVQAVQWTHDLGISGLTSRLIIC